MQRTHRLRADRAWLPPGVRRTGRAVTGAVWAGTGAAIAGAVIASPVTLVAWKALALGGISLAVAGERAGNAMLRRQIARMTRGEIELAKVTSHAEGDLVVVRGTIATERPLRGLLLDAEGVYRRLTVKARGTWVHEAAVDFTIIDERGTRVNVQAAGARWIVPRRELVEYPAARFVRDDVPAQLRKVIAGFVDVDAFEQILLAGTAVQIVGYKTVSADVAGQAVDYRLPPQLATLRSGAELPVVITALADLPR